ncbi:MAG: hypothetical protein AAB553_04515 [Patescibacteria group bacterium]
MYEIIPSPGTNNKDWAEMEKKIELVKPFSRTIHIDVVDGKFAPHTTFADPAPFVKYTQNTPASENSLLFEVHLMVDEPINHLQRWADAGFHRFIGHVEKMSDQVAFVAAAQHFGEVGLALDKQTSIDGITIDLENLDTVLVMTIQAGHSGQLFEEDLLQKVEKLSQQTSIPIEVDGGINDETISIAAAHGASRFVATSFLYNLQTPQQQYDLLKKELKIR